MYEVFNAETQAMEMKDVFIAGKCVGFGKYYVFYDPETGEMKESPDEVDVLVFESADQIKLAPGCIIETLTRDAFNELVSQYYADQVVNETIDEQK
jgi:hypothetical protein